MKDSSLKQSKMANSRKQVIVYVASYVKALSTSPVVISTCCESVIGCYHCAQTWINSGKNTCPKHQEGFNSATISTRSFEDFLKNFIKQMVMVLALSSYEMFRLSL